MDRHVAISATCWRILRVRSVGAWPGRLPCSRRDLAPTMRRRLGPHHHQSPRRVCSSCAAFSLTTSASVSTCACAFVHHSVDCGGHDRSVCSPGYLYFLCLPCMPICIDSCICLGACSQTLSVSSSACCFCSLLLTASICTRRSVFFSFQITLLPSTSDGMFLKGKGGAGGGEGVRGPADRRREKVGPSGGWLARRSGWLRRMPRALSLLYSDFVHALFVLCSCARWPLYVYSFLFVVVLSCCTYT